MRLLLARTRILELALALGPALLAGGCASTAPAVDATAEVFEEADVVADTPARGDWHAFHLPGKPATRYERCDKDGRSAVSALSVGSASMWRRHLEPARDKVGEVSFSWWVQDLIPGASVADIDREDAPARVIFAFAGDTRRLSLRNRAMFELAHALTGEPPPYATLMYVWDSSLPVGTVVINPRSDRVRKIVVDSGPAHLRRWRDHKRDLAADFRLAFGEEPGALSAIAVMTDSDNTRSRSSAWYGPVDLH